MKERYIVITMDGKAFNAVADTFAECIEMFGEDNIFQMSKLFFQEEEK